MCTSGPYHLVLNELERLVKKLIYGALPLSCQPLEARSGDPLRHVFH